MKRKVLLIALASLMVLGGQSFAELCTIDAVPAATLLLPYFEVSLTPNNDDPNAQGVRNVDTFFSINNASAAPTVAHVTLWGDWSQPSIDFDIFLTGYDVETVSLSDVFNNGNLPQTAHAQRDRLDRISPHGRRNEDPANASGPNPGLSENPQWDSWSNRFTDEPTDNNPSGCNPAQTNPFAPDYCPRFDGCNANLPLNGGNNPVLTGSFLDRIRCGHTGRGLQCNEGDNCIGRVHKVAGDNDYIARGYITIDNVNDCNLLFPDSPGYFGTSGFASNINQLWGDYFILQDGRAVGDNLVAIEAWNDRQYGMTSPFTVSPTDPVTYTFYGRYVAGLGTDQREPLGTQWATRYFKPNALFDGGTDLFVWRDSTCDPNTGAYDNPGADECVEVNGVIPPWYPMLDTQIVSFDTQEDATEICGATTTGGPVSPPGTTTIEDVCFPLETGRYPVTEGDLADIPYDFGWLYLNLNFTLGPTPNPGPDPGDDPYFCNGDRLDPNLFGNLAQSWVGADLDSEGIFSVGYAGTQLSSACNTPIRPNYTFAADNDQVITGDL